MATVGIGETSDLRLDWLVRLRWGSAVGQAAMVVAARVLVGPDLPATRMLVLVALLAASNAALQALAPRARSPRLLCGAALALDILILTGLLHASGGPYNPFSVLYLVYITLAAVVLRARWTWFLAFLAACGYGVLFVSHIPLEHLDHAGPEMSRHLQGMWLAFALAAALTAFFVVRLTDQIEERDRALAEARERANRHERLAAVTTLAAGAAHELGTPLATIAVAARELERGLGQGGPGDAGRLAEDVALIRAEVDRCRAILTRLAADSGQLPGEAPQDLRACEVIAEVVERLPTEQKERLRLDAPADAPPVRLPRAALEQIVHNLLRNAFEATAGRVGLDLSASPTGLILRVQDDGPGMAPEVLARVGEPFFSTKGPGKGLGLGVFIAKSLSEQMGGRLVIESAPGQGTVARLEIPAGQR